MRDTRSHLLHLYSVRFHYPVLGVLLVAMLAALPSLINRTGHSPLTERTQTRNLPASHASPTLLNKPEIVPLRSTHARHYDLGNGKRLAVVGATPLNYQDAEGNWQPVQPGFTRAENGWRVRDNTLRSTFASDNTAVQLESYGEVISWQPVALEINDDAGNAHQLAVPAPGDAVQAEAVGRTLRYAGAWSDATLLEQFHSSAGSLKQELILAQAPTVAAEGEWFSLRAHLVLPNGVQIVANGQAQTGEFTTYGAVQFRQADGTSLLSLASPLAYEQGNRSVVVGGRYRVVPHGDSITLWVQTPLTWWLAAGRQYPAVLDPTMQVLRAVESATIRYPYNPLPLAQVLPQVCVGFHDQEIWTPDHEPHYSRGYVRFELPSLPDEAILTNATLVAAPSETFQHWWYEDSNDELTRVHTVTQDWSFLQGITSTAATTTISHFDFSDQAVIPKQGGDFPKGPDRPATTWDVFGDVVNWYIGASPNYGFALTSQFEGLLEDHGSRSEHCFPTTAEWSNLDEIVDNPNNPNATTDGPGLGLLIEYISPQLAANEMRLVTAPSTQPGDTYKDQYHQYVPPYTNGWQLVAARGQLGAVSPNTPLQWAEEVPTDLDLPVTSDAGAPAPGYEPFGYKPNLLLLNSYQRGHQQIPGDLAVRVLPGKPEHDDGRYHLQIADAQPAPVMPPVGVSTTMAMAMGSGFMVGQELKMPVSTTVEIRIPYDGMQPESFNIQLFPSSVVYGTRQEMGMQLMAGPDAWEIEVVVPPSRDPTWPWLLAAIYDDEWYPAGAPVPPYLYAQIVACENSLDVVVYPVDGECVELQRPPSPIPASQLYTPAGGNVRIFSPAGFTADCDVSCTTKDTLPDGTKVAAYIGYEGDDDRWVALKGGRFDISGSNINTTADVRLIMVDFAGEGLPITLPVLRGEFSVDAMSGEMTPISAADDTYLLVKAPLPQVDMDSGWNYKVVLAEARMRAVGPLSRSIEPTDGAGSTTLDFDAQWSITARGGVDLQGAASLSNSPGDFQVGTLIVTPPLGSNYTMEHDPRHADANYPAVIPEFKHIRMTDATLSQPAQLGGARVPVQAIILPPGQSELEGSAPLHCGDSCFDLRGEGDAMTATGPKTVRGFRMPDLIIQDQAGTVMINTLEGAEIYSRDHPASRLRLNANDYSFSYEAFDATIRIYQGVCPLPRNPLDPTEPPSGGQETTIVEGKATMSLPNAESESGGPQISVGFRLCENSLREMSFIFNTGDNTALPLGNSGLFMNLVGGTISLAPEQGPQPGYTTVVLEVGVRGMSPDAASSNVFIKGVVTIDTRGLFDMQLQAGLKVVGGYGVGVDGHFWVAWAPLDLGFEVQACVPYSGGFDNVAWDPGDRRCQGNELLYGSLRAHLWQGQGWQNQYSWLPDNDDLHIAARYVVSINIAAGMLVDWSFIVIPPEDIQLFQITLAFGEFCTNDACTAYEWGVMGAYTLLGYDLGMYYGFDSGLDFILGSADYLLIDEAGQAFSASLTPAQVGARASSPYTVTIPAAAPSAMFVLGWDPGLSSEQLVLSLQEPPPGNRTIDANTVALDVTATTTPTVRGSQTIIVIDDPLPGDWVIDIDGNDPLVDHNFAYFVNKPKPSLSLSGLPKPTDPIVTPLHPGDVVEIEWTSNISSAHNAWFSLYYTVTNPITDSEVIVGPIVERLPLTAQGTYKWQVQGLAMIDDFYHVFARIDSDVAAAVNACGAEHQYNPDPTANVDGCGTMLNSSLVLPAAELLDLARFTYVDWKPPECPTLVDARPVDWTSVLVQWQPNSDVDLGGYLVRCTQGSLTRTVRTAAVHISGSTLLESARVNGLIPYQTATCSLRAYDTSGNVSCDSTSTPVVPTEIFSAYLPLIVMGE